MVLEQLAIHIQKKKKKQKTEHKHRSSTIHKNSLKMDHRPKCKMWNLIKALQRWQLSVWKDAQKMPYITCHQGNEQIKQQRSALQHIYGSKDVAQQEPSVITGGDARGAAASHKTCIFLPHDPAFHCVVFTQRSRKHVHTKACMDVYSSSIHNCPNMRVTKTPSSRWWVNNRGPSRPCNVIQH